MNRNIKIVFLSVFLGFLAFSNVSFAVTESVLCEQETNLIKNGDFENPIVHDNAFGIFSQINNQLEWLVDWVNPLSEGIVGVEIQRGIAGVPYSGYQHVELDGNHPVMMWQDINTNPGYEYNFNFQYSPRPTIGEDDSSIEVLVNGESLGIVSGDGLENTDTSWSFQDYSFVADSFVTRVELKDISPDTSYGGYIDDVNLKCVKNTIVYICSDELDNDGDGLIDSSDPACHTDGNSENSESYNPNSDTEVTEEPIVFECSDGIDNDEDGLIDYPFDNGCESGEDNKEVTRSSNRGGSIPSGYLGSSQGEVLGASTSCGIYVDKFLRRGYDNDIESVKKVQKFLNDYMLFNLKVDGVFGQETENALKKFQIKQSQNILFPWSFKDPTGIFYITTQTEVNNIMCPELDLKVTDLIPFEKNPSSPKKI